MPNHIMIQRKEEKLKGMFARNTLAQEAINLAKVGVSSFSSQESGHL